MAIAKWSSRLSLLLILLMLTTLTASAADFANPAFQKLWNYTDYAVERGRADYSWIWGPEPFTGDLGEWYTDSAGQRRTVQYFDKSRMEINDPTANQNTEWYVTNGLLVREMITGQVQVGDNKFIASSPARISVAGDANNTFPYYGDLQRVYNIPSTLKIGDHVTRGLVPSGFSTFSQYANDPASQVVEMQHNYGIPRAFWNFMTRGGTVYDNGAFVYRQPLFNWLYVTGYPIADPYWIKVKVKGVEQDVMFQAFERRLLTYTPANPAQYQVEMGNVGRHYYQWRYTDLLSGHPAVITNPQPGATVKSPLLVQGFENGQAFEATITVRLKTNSGTELAKQSTMVHRPDITIPGPFEANLTFTAPPGNTPGRLEIVIFSAQNGSEQILYTENVMIAGA
jgi:hypothetical protein